MKKTYPKKVYELARKHFEKAQQHSCFADDGSWECPCFMGDCCAGGEDGPNGLDDFDYCKKSILGLMKMRYDHKVAYEQTLAAKQ